MPRTQQCTATSKQSGQRCKRSAVPGATVCTTHGGRAPQVARKAAQRVDREAAITEARRIITRRDVDPIEALLESVQWTAGEVDYWRAKVAELDEDDVAGLLVTKTEAGTEKGQPTDLSTREAAVHIYVRLLHEATDNLAKYAALALRAGVDERRIRLAEQQGALVALAVRRILNALDLTPAQLERVPVVVPRELRALTAQEDPR